MERLDVGKIVRPHGLRGEVVVELWTNRTERMAAGTVLEGAGRSFVIERSTPHHGRWIVTFAGVSGREGAEAVRDVVLTAPPLDDPDALWVHELVGCELVDTEGVVRGRVVEVQANPASDLLVLDGGGLVPLRFVTEHRPGRIVAELPAGLLD